MIDYPEQEASAAIDKLLELRELMEHGDPVGRALAEDALEAATRRLHQEGVLDWLISCTARLQRYQ